MNRKVGRALPPSRCFGGHGRSAPPAGGGLGPPQLPAKAGAPALPAALGSWSVRNKQLSRSGLHRWLAGRFAWRLGLATTALSGALGVPAADIAWNNPVGGSWFVATNWSPAVVPGPSDTAILAGPGSYVVTFSGAATIGGLRLGETPGTKTLRLDGGTLTLNGPGTVAANGEFRHVAGTFAGTGALTVDGRWQWSGGIVQRAGEIGISPSGQAAWDSTALKSFSGGTIRNRGRVIWSAGALTSGVNPATLSNEPGGAIEWQGALSWSGSRGVLQNGGTLSKTGLGTGICAAAWTNTGLLSVESGVLQWNGGGGGDGGTVTTSLGATALFLSGTYDFSHANISGGLRVSGATLVLNTGTRLQRPGSVTVAAGTLRLVSGAAHEIDSLDFTGGNIDNRDTLRVLSQGHWSGGTLLGAGTVINESTLLLDGVATKIFAGGTIRNRGTLTWTTGGVLCSSGPAVLLNETTGVVDFAGTGGWGGTQGRLDNSGTWRKTAAGIGTYALSWLNRPGATLSVLAGAAHWTADGEGGGRLTAAAGAAHEFRGGPFNLTDAVLTGPGSNRVAGATVTLAAGSRFERPGTLGIAAGHLQLVSGAIHEVNSVDFSGGFWEGSDHLRSDGSSIWAGGTLVATGEWINEGSLQLAGTGTKLFNGGSIRNQGSLVWIDGSISSTANPARLVNEPGATVEFRGGNNWAGTLGTFDNYGSFRKTGLAVDTYSARWLNRPGANTAIEQGLASWRGGGTLQGDVAVAVGATLEFNTGTFDVVGARCAGPGTNRITGATVNVQAGSSLSPQGILDLMGGTWRLASGTAQAIDSIRLRGGIFELLDPLRVATQGEWTTGTLRGTGTWLNQGLLLLAGAGNRIFAGGTLRNEGTLRWAQGAITADGDPAVLLNAPTGTVQLEGAVVWAGTAGRLSNEGVMIKTGTNTRASISATYTNVGTLQILEGTILFNGDWGQTTGRMLLADTSATMVEARSMILGGATLGTGTLFTLGLNNGTNAPGDGRPDGPVGTLRFNPGLRLGTNSVTEFDLGGPIPGTNHDQIVVEYPASPTTRGDVTLNGLLRARLIGGYNPPAGTRLTVLHARVRSGQFTSLDLPPGFAVEYTASDVILRRDSAPPMNSAPAIAAVPPQTLTAGQAWTIALPGTDPDVPPQVLHWSLLNAPPGVLLDALTGALSWSPAVTQPAGDYTISVQVADDGAPSLSATASIAVHLNPAPASPLIETWTSLAVLNPDAYLLAADEVDSDPATQRHLIRTQARVLFAAPDLVTRSATYRVTFQLVNRQGQPVALRLPDGSVAKFLTVDRTETLPRLRTPFGTDFISSEQLDFNADLLPAKLLEADEMYRVEASLSWRPTSGAIFTATGDGGETAWQRFLHFTNTDSNDPALNAIAEVQSALFLRTYAIATVPTRRAFRLRVPVRVHRFDAFAQTPGDSPVTLTLEGRLREETTGQEIALQANTATAQILVPSHDGAKPAGPAFRDTMVTLDLEPAPNAEVDILAGHYLAEISVSHADGLSTTAAPRRGVPGTSAARALLRFDGRLFFGQVETQFGSIANDPVALSVLPGSHVLTSLAIDALSGFVTSRPAERYGDGTALSVRLYPDGHAELDTGTVAVTGPSPDVDVINGIGFRRDHVVLSPTGAEGGMTLILPAGLGYRATPGSRRLNREFALGRIPLKDTLAPFGLLTSGVPGELAEETKPLWLPANSLTWDVGNGVLEFTVSGSPAYVRTAELNRLETLASQGQLVDPTMARKRSNDGYFRAATSLSPRLRVTADARGAAILEAQVQLGAGQMETHFPHGVAVSWTHGNLSIQRDQLTPATSTLSGVAPLSVTYQAGCSGCGNLSAASLQTIVGTPRSQELHFTPDGGLAGATTLAAPTDLAWGRPPGPTAAFAHRAEAFLDARFLMAGVFLTGGATENAAIDRPATLLLSGVSPADLTAAERPGTDDYEDGLADYAGLNFRVAGDGANTAQSLVGGTSTGRWQLGGRSKYYVRASGVSGLHEAVPGSFPAQLTVYGYPFRFSNYGLNFRATHSGDSRINGLLSVPAPSAFDQNFERLQISCVGDLESAELPEAEQGQKKNLRYWLAEFIPLGLEFQRRDDLACAPGNGILTVPAQAFATHLGSPLFGTLGFMPSGEIVSPRDVRSGAAPLPPGFDSRLAVPASFTIAGPAAERYTIESVAPAYFTDFDTRPSDQTGQSAAVDRGYVNLAGTMRLPFFEAMPVHIHTSGLESSPAAPIHLMQGGPEAAWQASTDDDNRGYPAAIAGAYYHDAKNSDGTTFATYRPHAQRHGWAGVIDFDFPLQWSSSARSFQSVTEPQTAAWMFVLRTERHCRYLSAEHADVTFGATAEAVPFFNLTQLAFEIGDQEFGLARTFTAAGLEAEAEQIREGLDQLQQLVAPVPETLFLGPAQTEVFPTIDRFVQELRAIRSANPDPSAWAQARNQLVQTYFSGPTARFPQALQQLPTEVGDLQIQQKLGSARVACRALQRLVARSASGDDRAVSRQFLRELLNHLNAGVAFLATGMAGAAFDDFIAEQIGPQGAALDEVARRLGELADRFGELATASAQDGPFRHEIEAVFQAHASELNGVGDQVRDEVLSQLARFRDDEDPLEGGLAIALRNALVGRTMQSLLATPLVPAVQTAIRLRVADQEEAMRESFDSVGQIFTQAMRSIVSYALSQADAKFQEMLGEVGALGAMASITGHAHFSGDSMTEVRLDGVTRLEFGVKLECNAFLQVRTLTSDTPSAFCATPGENTIEAILGASGSLTSFGQAPRGGSGEGSDTHTTSTNKNSVTMRIKAAFEKTPSQVLPNLKGFAGMVDIRGSIGTGGNFVSARLSAAVGLSADSYYISGIASAKLLGFDGEAGFMFGRICDPDALYWDPDVSRILGDFPVFGVYGYVEVHIPGFIDLGCVLSLKAQVGMGAGFLIEGPQHQVSFVGKMLVGASGEALCIFSIEGQIALAFKVGEGGVAWTGRGHFSVSLLFITVEVTATLTFVDGEVTGSVD